MYIEKIQFDNVRYNPETSAFETLVKISDGGQSYAYPVHVTASLYAEFGIIARGLAQKARALHRAHDPGLRLTRRADPAGTAPRRTARGSIIDRLMGRHAA
ncbi:hypothetical protein D6850_14545 [Roseovarius spongiae]|uniref:Uncharacterized protein n=1 Tax=Roseovarius spongiae TaxID=2320272 RepID=A0A3A8B2C8_9RHOB|nr:hypothetical protein [Roseovarius spongiae]RKF13513.1 hypothetical protein D6850_14545 [Roseovarius spongiae]